MMLRKILIMVLILSAGIIMLFPGHADAGADTDKVLLVYNDRAKMTVIADLIRACGKTPLTVDIVGYNSGLLENYEYVVLQDPTPLKDALQAGKRPVCLGDGFQVVPGMQTETIDRKMHARLTVYNNTQSIIISQGFTYISDHYGEAVGRISINGQDYPLGVMTDTVMYAPYFGRDDMSVFAVAKMLNAYFGNFDGGKMYIMIDEVYPFDDRDMLELIADRFFRSGIPFVMSLMPVYQNTDYPAFKRYADTLRYIQSRSGSLIMHDPLVTGNELVGDTLDVRMDNAYASFEENGIHVYPETLFPYEVSLNMLMRIQPTNELFISLPIDTIIKYDVFADEDELDSALTAINQKWIQIGDYRRNFTDKTDIYEEASIDNDYVYIEKDESHYEFLVDKGNRILSIIVLISSIVIVGLIMLGYRLYQSKFLKRN
jgi:hypothetical protein